MKLAPFLAALVVFCHVVSPLYAASETAFDPTVDDLPLMDGLKADPDQETLFTAPKAGRIAESVAKGPVGTEDVYKFYRKTLPHLGWHAVDNHIYSRGGEVLHIDARAVGGLTTVRFSIKPTT